MKPNLAFPSKFPVSVTQERRRKETQLKVGLMCFDHNSVKKHGQLRTISQKVSHLFFFFFWPETRFWMIEFECIGGHICGCKPDLRTTCVDFYVSVLPLVHRKQSALNNALNCFCVASITLLCTNNSACLIRAHKKSMINRHFEILHKWNKTRKDFLSFPCQKQLRN